MITQALIAGLIVVGLSMACIYLIFGKSEDNWMCWAIGVVTGIIAGMLKVGGWYG